ncbi:MAG TPA: VWA domain-containing protein [Gaiellaceae bacterium]|nr:VWA domain-containing protein [Gaiellaceae bacterium]
MSDAVAELTGFGRALRAEGLAVGTGAVEDFCRAAALLPLGDLYWAGRATLVAGRDEIPVYDRVFRRYFGGAGELPRPPKQRVVVRRHGPGATATALRGRDAGSEPEAAVASAVETLKRKRFSRCTPAELERLARLMAEMDVGMPLRRARRLRPARAGAPDLRRTIRRSFRTGGEPVERAWRARRPAPRRLVLVLDVSGSMSDYSRALLVFAHAALRSNRRWEAFCFGTRLTRLTRALGATHADDALVRAAEAVVDWDGGTRIGDSLKALLDAHGEGGLVRGAVVVVCSDGLDVGDPELLRGQMERLARLAHAVVWLNPLSDDPAYEPLARGMRAALPHVDVFASGHDLVSLEGFTRELERL